MKNIWDRFIKESEEIKSYDQFMKFSSKWRGVASSILKEGNFKLHLKINKELNRRYTELVADKV